MRKVRITIGAYLMDWVWSKEELNDPDRKNTEYDCSRGSEVALKAQLSFMVSI